MMFFQNEHYDFQLFDVFAFFGKTLTYRDVSERI